MTRFGTRMLAIAGMSLAGAAFVGCATAAPPAKTTESAGEFIDDSAITTRVKAAVLGDASLKSLQIGVETYEGVVQLSGFVDSRQSVRRAGDLAMAVEGVASVKNDLAVK